MKAREPWPPWFRLGAGIECPRCKRRGQRADRLEVMERRRRDRPPEWFKGIWYTAWDYCVFCRHSEFPKRFERLAE